MKVEKLVSLLVAAAVLSFSVVGCKSPQRLTPLPGLGGAKPIGDPNAGNPIGVGNVRPIENVEPPTRTTPPVRPGDIIPTSTKDLGTWQAAAEQPFKEPVYFDFDKAVVKASEISKVERVASAMKSQYAGKGAIRIEGHCDERGTEEYNRSLGERRALAVREKLVSLGLDPQMIDTISFGEDKPVDPGHGEAAWSKNRRGEFILIVPPGGVGANQ